MWVKMRKSKLSETFSKGVVLLVFLMLLSQFIFFAVKVIDNYRTDLSEVSPITPINVEIRGEIKETGQTKQNKKIRASGELKISGDSVKKYPPEVVVQKKDDGWKWDIVELNTADSSALVSLPYIGPYYAKKILEYRERLWGTFADIEQLLEIRGIDSVTFGKFSSRVYIDTNYISFIDLYELPQDSLAIHPYVGTYAAKGIVRFRGLCPKNHFSVDTLVACGVISKDQGRRLKRYIKK